METKAWYWQSVLWWVLPLLVVVFWGGFILNSTVTLRRIFNREIRMRARTPDDAEQKPAERKLRNQAKAVDERDTVIAEAVRVASEERDVATAALERTRAAIDARSALTAAGEARTAALRAADAKRAAQITLRLTVGWKKIEQLQKQQKEMPSDADGPAAEAEAAAVAAEALSSGWAGRR